MSLMSNASLCASCQRLLQQPLALKGQKSWLLHHPDIASVQQALSSGCGLCCSCISLKKPDAKALSEASAVAILFIPEDGGTEWRPFVDSLGRIQILMRFTSPTSRGKNVQVRLVPWEGKFSQDFTQVARQQNFRFEVISSINQHNRDSWLSRVFADSLCRHDAPFSWQ